MGIYCNSCGRDINALCQDNVSCVLGSPLCEDCYGKLSAECELAEFGMNDNFEAMIDECGE